MAARPGPISEIPSSGKTLRTDPTARILLRLAAEVRPYKATMRSQVIIHWGISSFYGWGVYGLNLALQWIVDPDLQPVASRSVRMSQITVDPLRTLVLRGFAEASAEFEARLREQVAVDPAPRVDVPLLVGLGDDFQSQPLDHGGFLEGSPTLGVTFFENPRLSAEAVARARGFPWIVTGSTWNEQVLRGHGVDRVTTVLQGIDPTLFHPAPRSGLFGSRFLVFSGGKLEFRKGQDLVVAALRGFLRRHPDAVLVTAWHSPWPQAARSLDQSGKAGPVPINAEGRLDVLEWAARNDIRSDQIVDLGAIPNSQLPVVLREMDVAVFPNRGEGGTNLVAMECMACGVPVVLSANTGHLDLVSDEVCFPLTRQGPVQLPGSAGMAIPGWGESSVEEIEEQLERVYRDREEASRRAARGAARLAGLTWQRTAESLKQVILRVSKGT